MGSIVDHISPIPNNRSSSILKDVLAIAILTILCVMILLHVYSIQQYPDDWDAADYAARCIRSARAIEGGIDQFAESFPGVHGPLMPLVNAAAMYVLPQADPYLVMFVHAGCVLSATIIGVYVVSRSVSSRKVALIVSVTILFTPPLLYWSSQVMHEGWSGAVYVLSCLAMIYDWRSKSVKSSCLLGVAAGLLLWVRLNYSIPGLLGIVCYGIAVLHDQKSWRRAFGCFASCAVVAAMWQSLAIKNIIHHAMFANTDRWATSGGMKPSDILMAARTIVGSWGIAACWLMLIGVAISVYVVYIGIRERRCPVVFSMALAVLASICLYCAMRNRNPRFLLPAVYPSGFMLAWFWGRSKAVSWHILCVLLFLQIASYCAITNSMVHGYIGKAVFPYRNRNSWEYTMTDSLSHALEYVVSEAKSTDRVVFLGHETGRNSAYLDYWVEVIRAKGSKVPTIVKGFNHLKGNTAKPTSAQKIVADCEWVVFCPGGPDRFMEVARKCMVIVDRRGKRVCKTSDGSCCVYSMTEHGGER